MGTLRDSELRVSREGTERRGPGRGSPVAGLKFSRPADFHMQISKWSSAPSYEAATPL